MCPWTEHSDDDDYVVVVDDDDDDDELHISLEQCRVL